MQRFDSALRLNVHAHTLALDGVYVRASGELVFRALPPPIAADVAEVARRTADETRAILERHGRSLEGLFEGAGDDEPDRLAEEQPALAACYGAAVGAFWSSRTGR